jgi:hypothetical protein
MSRVCVRCGHIGRRYVRGKQVCNVSLRGGKRWYLPLQVALCCPCCQEFKENREEDGIEKLIEYQVLEYTSKLFPMSGCMDSIRYSLEDWNKYCFQAAIKDIDKFAEEKEASRLKAMMEQAMSLLYPPPKWTTSKCSDWYFFCYDKGGRCDCSMQAIALVSEVSIKIARYIPAVLEASGMPPYDPDARGPRAEAADCGFGM